MDWPHAPAHRLGEAGAYTVTAATYLKAPMFRQSERLHLLTDRLLCLADQYGW